MVLFSQSLKWQPKDKHCITIHIENIQHKSVCVCFAKGKKKVCTYFNPLRDSVEGRGVGGFRNIEERNLISALC